VIAVSTVDRVGGVIFVTVAAVYFLGAGVVELLRAYVSRPPRSDAGTAGLPRSPARRTVEAGNSVTAESTDREEVAGRSSRVPSAAMAIEALTFPGPYSRIGNRR